MNSYNASTFGECWAEIYDGLFYTTNEAAMTMLEELAGGGRALELGIGTGRLALPLAQRGVEVHGLDVSPAMVEKLHAKPGGDTVSVTIGDMADVEVGGVFNLIYVVFNTLFGLLTQAEQVRCFHNVAQHLTAEGVFLIEAFVPDQTRFDREQSVRATTVDIDSVALEMSLHDAAQQRVTGQRVVITEQGTRLYPVQIRYAWPSELDLMAQLAGLRLRHRWNDWDRSPFTARSGKHISVYERTG